MIYGEVSSLQQEVIFGSTILKMPKSRMKSKGLGDSIAKVTHALGIDKVAEKIAHVLGEEDCGCDRRRMKLNELVSYVNIPEENYIFTEPKLFEVLECINIDGTEYNQGERILVDPSRPIYYHLKSLLIEEKIKRWHFENCKEKSS